jgi:hypothetical protein
MLSELTRASFGSGVGIDRIEDDHADRLVEEIRDLTPILDVMVRGTVSGERLLARVALEQMESATDLRLLIEVVALATGLGSRPFDHPGQQGTKRILASLAGSEGREDGHRIVGHTSLAKTRTFDGSAASLDRSGRSAVYPPTASLAERGR